MNIVGCTKINTLEKHKVLNVTLYKYSYCEDIILYMIKKFPKSTTDFIINKIFEEDLSLGLVNTSDRNWHFYLKLKDYFSILEKKHKIYNCGKSLGPFMSKEKVWEICNKF